MIFNYRAVSQDGHNRRNFEADSETEVVTMLRTTTVYH